MVAYTSLAGVLLLICIVYFILSILKKGKAGRLLCWTSVCCMGIVASFLLCIFLSNYKAKEILLGLGIGFCDWAMFSLFGFALECVQIKLNKTTISVIASIFLVDSLIHITNPINHFAMDYNYQTIEGIVLIGMKPKAIGYLHYFYFWFVAALMVYFCVSKLVKSPKIYRTKYVPITIMSASMLIWEVLYVFFFFNTSDHIGILLPLTMGIAYHSIYHFSPRSLLNQLQIYVTDNISDATILYDVDGNLLRSNKKASAIIEPEHLVKEETLRQYLGLDYDDSNEKKKINGRYYAVSYKHVYDKNGSKVGSTFILYDITKLEQQLEREHEIAVTDPLTGAYNRTGFLEAANTFLYESRFEAGFAMIVTGIKNFKEINSIYGSAAGDKVLLRIERMLHEFRHTHPLVYGRTSEGKFAELLPFDAVDELTNTLTCVDVPVDSDVIIHVEMSHGFILLDDTAKEPDFYYERALLALSECKRTANISALEYSYAMVEKAKRKQFLVSQMHQALRENQFFVELQPQISLSTRSIAGAEALVRWQHPSLGRISPAEFIPLFEENGFITLLDEFVWKKTAEIIKNLADRGIYDGPISINVSQVDIMGMNVPDVLERIVNEVGIEPGKLHVEITESACVEKRETLINTMNTLRSRGFILEIDDFGSGYSSLNVLMALPFDVVKLDMAFMREKDLQGKRGIIVNTIASMIHSLDAEIIVEGVETENNVENTVMFGGDIVQGYYFSRPLPVDNFIEFVKSKQH